MCDARYGALAHVHQDIKEAQPHTHKVQTEWWGRKTIIRYGDQRVDVSTRILRNEEKLDRKMRKLVQDHDQGTARHLVHLKARHEHLLQRQRLINLVHEKAEAVVRERSG